MSRNRINDGFGWRIDPVNGKRTWHNGQDYTTYIGVPITTNIPMTVVDTGFQGGYGKIVTLRDNSGNTYKYAHLDEMTVKKGQVIPPDTLIGYVGNTGKSTGAHLHFEAADAAGVSKDPMAVNPATGKLWSDVSGFKKGQTFNESIKDAAPDKNRYNRPSTPATPTPTTPPPDSAINDIVKRREQENKKTGPGSNTRPRPGNKDVGVLINPRHKLSDGG
jgi:murein DD-endopeptidase MepM/ murein hydrolase activator NlpD